ncbi:MAG: hypothetical protein ACI92G_004188, partial [Candidatus Pelagisphaera sp.]
EAADVATAPTVTGGTLDFQGVEVALTRAASTGFSPGVWTRT